MTNKYEHLIGVPFSMRLKWLQGHYLGAFKGRMRAERDTPRVKAPANYYGKRRPAQGSEAERVLFEGRG